MTRTLRQGQRGPDVKRWQTFLAANGHPPGKIDGVFGEATAAATRAFQAAHGLTADAIVGPKTLAAASKLGLRGLRRLTNAEVTPALTAEARKVLVAHGAEPFGSEFPFEIAGIHYVARIEEHYHEPGGPLKPWGYHHGVSLFIDSLLDQTIHVADEATDTADETGATGDVALPIATRGVVVLDPGHGGTTIVGESSPNNAKSPSGVLEKELTLRMAELVRAQIAARAANVQVEMTRTSDVNVGLAERAALAGRVGADLFLSLHFNGFNGASRGVEAWVRPRDGGNVNLEEDRAFAQRVLEAAFEAIRSFDPGTANRGVKEKNLGVLRDELYGNTPSKHPCRGCLLELEFLDVPKVDALFNTGENAEQVRTKVAAAIADAIVRELAPG